MNYFTARRAEELFRKYKCLALAYWKSLPQETTRPLFGGENPSPGETNESLGLRQQINVMFPEVNELAHTLGVGVTWESYPAPIVGGPIVPVNILMSVIDRNMGHSPISKVNIVDVIDRAIGTAAVVRKRAFLRMVIPIYWPIDILAFGIRLPFVILRKAGIPGWVEENIVSQIIKIAVTLGFILLLAYLGLERYAGDVLRSLVK